jgi:hypothetical protein
MISQPPVINGGAKRTARKRPRNTKAKSKQSTSLYPLETVSQMFGISLRTLDRWMTAADLTAQRDTTDQRRRLLDERTVEILQSLHASELDDVLVEKKREKKAMQLQLERIQASIEQGRKSREIMTRRVEELDELNRQLEDLNAKVEALRSQMGQDVKVLTAAITHLILAREEQDTPGKDTQPQNPD